MTLTSYMHRFYHQLQVLELEYEYKDDNGAKCDVELQPIRYGTYEYDFIINKSISTDTAYHLTVKRMEEPPSKSTMQPLPPTVITQVFDKIPNVVSFNGENNIQRFIAVYKTTVEKSKRCGYQRKHFTKDKRRFFLFC